MRSRLTGTAVAAVLALSIAVPATAAPPRITGTISLDTPNPAYQQPVTFTTSISGKLKPGQYAMVYVECYQPDKPNPFPNYNGLVWAELDHPNAAFVLGDPATGWTLWQGGSADCVAHLWLYPGIPLELARVPFRATG